MSNRDDDVVYRELVSRLLKLSVIDNAGKNVTSRDTLLYRDYLNHNNYTSKEWYLSEYIKYGIHSKLGIPYNELIHMPIADVEMILDVASRHNNEDVEVNNIEEEITNAD